MLTLRDVAIRLSTVEEHGTRELLPLPEQNLGFSELEEVTFRGPPGLRGQLLVDDAPVPAIAVGDCLTWRWKPGFYAGEVRAEFLALDGSRLGSWRLDVSPDDRKLGRDHFFDMLKSVRAFDPLLVVGQEPARHRLGALGQGEDPLVALARLRARAGAIRRALRAVIRQPLRTLRARRSLVPPHRVRRVDRRTALVALRQPMLLEAMGRIEADESPGTARSLLADVPETERHLDSPGNRCLFAMLRALQRRCIDLFEELLRRVGAEEESQTRSGLAPRWPAWRAMLEALQRDLNSLSRCSPFRDVRQAEVTSAGLNAVSAHPLYARAWRLGWEALRSGVAGLEEEDLLPMNPTWEIYERWCFVELARRLRQWLPGVDWRRRSPTAVEGGCSDGAVWWLWLQPEFPSSSGQQRPGFWSVSRLRRPDIVLGWERSGDSGFVVLDAKYRVGRPNVLDAMSSAHLYQDSLRMKDHRPSATVLLVPAPGGAPWLEDGAFVTRHRVGIAALGPDAASPPWLRKLLLGGPSDDLEAAS